MALASLGSFPHQQEGHRASQDWWGLNEFTQGNCLEGRLAGVSRRPALSFIVLKPHSKCLLDPVVSVLGGRDSGAGDGQGGLACSSPWGHKELDTTERLN